MQSANVQDQAPSARIVDRPSLKLVGPKIRVGAFSPKIGQLWGEFVPTMKAIPGLASSKDSYGVCIAPEAGNADVEEFDYMASVPVDQFTDEHADLAKVVVPGGKYAIFTHRGGLDKLPESVAAFSKALDASDIKVDHSLMLELYDERFNPMSSDSELDLLLPLKKKAKEA